MCLALPEEGIVSICLCLKVQTAGQLIQATVSEHFKIPNLCLLFILEGAETFTQSSTGQHVMFNFLPTKYELGAHNLRVYCLCEDDLHEYDLREYNLHENNLREYHLQEYDLREYDLREYDPLSTSVVSTTFMNTTFVNMTFK